MGLRESTQGMQGPSCENRAGVKGKAIGPGLGPAFPLLPHSCTDHQGV